MTKDEVTLQVKLILSQQGKERHYTQQKPYSHTLCEKLHESLTQLKLKI